MGYIASALSIKEVVRSRKHEPKRGGAARRRWMEEGGWVMVGVHDETKR